MSSEEPDKRPAWWILYAIVLLLVGLVGLVEMRVVDGRVRKVLECAVVVGGFALMLIWVRFNRRHSTWN